MRFANRFSFSSFFFFFFFLFIFFFLENGFRSFFLRMVFGPSYREDFFCTEYTYTQTHNEIQSKVFFYFKYAEIDFEIDYLTSPFCNENADRILK